MMRFFVVLLMGVLVSGCQLLPGNDVVEEAPQVAQVNQSFDIEEVGEVDVATAGQMEGLVKVSVGQSVLFKNSGDGTVRLTYELERVITQDIVPRGQFSFKYPGGWESVKVEWDGGGVTLQRRDVTNL